MTLNLEFSFSNLKLIDWPLYTDDDIIRPNKLTAFEYIDRYTPLDIDMSKLVRCVVYNRSPGYIMHHKIVETDSGDCIILDDRGYIEIRGDYFKPILINMIKDNKIKFIDSGEDNGKDI